LSHTGAIVITRTALAADFLVAAYRAGRPKPRAILRS
jgi:hypothetical protein